MFPTAQVDRPWAMWPAVRTAEEACAFVEAMGACLFHRKNKAAVPALSDVVAPDDEIAGHPMIWKDELHEAGRLFYGMAVRGDTSFMVMDLLPAFYRLQGMDTETYLAQYDRGVIDTASVRVLRALVDYGQLSTKELRRAARLAGPGEKPAFTAATSALRRTLTVTQAFSKSRVRAGYEYVWDLFERMFPEVGEAAVVRYPDRAEAITAVTARCHAWLDPDSDVAALFGWKAGSTQYGIRNT